MSTEETKTEIKEDIVTETKEEETPATTPSPDIKDEPKDNAINEQILETLKALNETNTKLKAELEGQKATINEMRDEIEANKPLNITVDEFIGVYDYSKDKYTIIDKEQTDEESKARKRIEEIKSMYNII